MDDTHDRNNREPPDKLDHMSGFSDFNLAEENTIPENSQEKDFFVMSPLIATADIPENEIIGEKSDKQSKRTLELEEDELALDLNNIGKRSHLEELTGMDMEDCSREKVKRLVVQIAKLRQNMNVLLMKIT